MQTIRTQRLRLFTLTIATVASALFVPSVMQAQETLDEAKRLTQQVEQLFAQANYVAAIPIAQRVVDIRKKLLPRNHPDYAEGLGNLGTMYMQVGRFKEAEPLLKETAEIERVIGEHTRDYGASLNNLATLYMIMGAYDKAEVLYIRSRDLYKEVMGETNRDYAASLSNLAVLYTTIGAYDKAEPLYLRATEIDQKVLGESADVATDLLNHADFYRQIHLYAKAEPLQVKAVEIRKTVFGSEHPEYAAALMNLGGTYFEMNQYAKAEPLLVEAKRIIQKSLGEVNLYYYFSLMNLAALYTGSLQYPKAEPLLIQALQIKKQFSGEAHPEYAIALNNLATLYYGMERYSEAKPLNDQASGIIRKVLSESHPMYALTLRSQAALEAATNHPAEALPTLLHVLQIQQTNIRNIFGFSAEPAMRAYVIPLRDSLSELISLTASKKNDQTAIDATLTWVLRRKAITQDSVIRFHEAQNLSLDTAMAQRIARYRYVVQQLSNMQFNPAQGGTAKLEEQRSALREEKENLEAEINRALSRNSKQPLTDTVDVKTVQQRLPERSALVEFVRVPLRDFKGQGIGAWKPAHYFAFVLSSRPTRMIDLGEARFIDKAINSVRENIKSVASDYAENLETQTAQEEKRREIEYRQVSKELCRLIFEPLVPAIGHLHSLYIAPDDQLNLVPFEALVGSDDKYLIEAYQFIYLSNGRDLIKARAPRGRGTVVFAAPDYNLGLKERRESAESMVKEVTNGVSKLSVNRSQDLRGLKWEQLKGSEVEARTIKRELTGSSYAPVKVYTDKRALEEVFKSIRSPRILHVSTHGFFLPDQPVDPRDLEGPVETSTEFGAARGLARLRGAENPLLRSGLVLTGANTVGQNNESGAEDGWVTAEEIAQMDLRGTDLVVLSACDTGLGDVKVGEGVYGLRRALQYAGAQTVVMTLYKVPDEQTAELMKSFYQGLRKGKPKLAALHAAQLAMIRQRRAANGAAHPFFWGSFVLAGDPK